MKRIKKAPANTVALEQLERAAKRSPTVDSLCKLGLAYARLRRYEQAKEALSRAIQLDPEHPGPIFQLGSLLVEAGDLQNALICHMRAVSLEPSSVPMRGALGKLLAATGRIDAAVEQYQQVLSENPESLETCVDLLTLLEAHSRFREAEPIARRLVEASTELRPESLVRLGTAQSKQGKYAEAIESFELALAAKPTLTTVPSRLAYALFRSGRCEESLACLERAVAAFPELYANHSSLVYAAHFSPRYSAEQLLKLALGWSEQHARPLVGARGPHSLDRSPERRLRLGYVSPDFRDHVQRLFMLPVLAQHDHANFEVVGYSSAKPADAWTERIRAHTDEWHEVSSLSDAELARKIRADRIDVLVDLTMHMAGTRLRTFAEKPAPVQVSWLAYPGTTGVDGIDYRLTDPYLDPPGAPLPYAEESLWLPNCFWCYDPGGAEPGVGELPALEQGYVTFGCFNNFMKLNREVFALWARVLVALPGARLLLRAPDGWARDFASQVLDAHGVNAGRVEFVNVQNRHDYLATYRRVDIALDSFPYNGHTTSLDAFWMGVPVVTLVGSTVAGRAGLCQSHNLGLTELVANTPDQFVEIATQLVKDLPKLSSLRQELRARLESSPLMDAARFTRDLEGLYRVAWRRYCGASA